MKITPVSKNLDELFRGNFVKIPRFQRPYDWDRDNLVEFWNDLKDRSDPEYFMGSIVVYYDKKDKTVLALVDGQQRITTITIMLAIIRNLLDDLDEPGSANGVHALIERPDLDDKQRFVLEHDPSDKFLQYRIQSRTPNEKTVAAGPQQENIQSAYKYLEGVVREHITVDLKGKASASVKFLKHLRDCLLQMQFIAVELDNEDDAYLIFETLNTRGKDLRVTDLLKNHFMRLIPSRNKAMDTTKNTWDEIVTRLSSVAVSIDPDSFLLHYWLSKHSFVSKASLFIHLKDLIKKTTAKSWLEDIRSASATYVRSMAPTEAKWANEERALQESLQALRIFGVAQAAPLILSIMRSYEAKIISLKSTRQTVDMIEKFTFQFNALTQSRGGGGVSNMYAKLAQSVSAANTPQKFANVAADMKEKFLERIPDETEFMLPFARLIYRASYTRNRNLVRYVLTKIARHYGMPIEVDSASLTVEHILPQSQGVETDDEFDVGAIGNLIFIGAKLNGKIDTKPFKEKMPQFTRANLVYADEFLLDQKTWNEKKIADRGIELAKVGYRKIWNL